MTFLFVTCLIECLPIIIFGVSVNCFSFLFDAISMHKLFFLIFKVWSAYLPLTMQELTLSRSSLILLFMSAGEVPEVDRFVSSANIEA